MSIKIKKVGNAKVNSLIISGSRPNSNFVSSISQPDNDVKIKLSLQKSTDAERVRDNLIKQNKNLRVANMILKQELVQTKGCL